MCVHPLTPLPQQKKTELMVSFIERLCPFLGGSFIGGLESSVMHLVHSNLFGSVRSHPHALDVVGFMWCVHEVCGHVSPTNRGPACGAVVIAKLSPCWRL